MVKPDKTQPSNPQSLKTQNLGHLQGPLLIFGGVYSNLQSLQALQAIASQEQIPPSNIVFTGDAVAYCADPEACVELFRTWSVHAIAGNVELQLQAGQADCGCNFNDGSLCDRLSQQWYRYAQAQLSPASLAWMQQLPEFLRFTYAGLECLVVHGSYLETSEFVFASTPWEHKAKNFAASGADVILSGHSGLPWHTYADQQLWLNAGVIGMPANDGTPRVWYTKLAVLDEVTLAYSRHSYTYDVETTVQRMEQHGLPASYAETLKTGLWEDCSILPVAETRSQGQPLTEYSIQFELQSLGSDLNAAITLR
ncbi:MAG: metallophosphoesterase family protein [Cyanobacteria bacterium P01_H01_bin.121]